ncbi:methylenetetrahydrofolate reductase [Vreelandella andesensis]|uniref:Methylenetetrahydrofolate reductase n=1 Tax=Vreelandella andesensis TaxID=447567 RepID=A0A433KPF1_9GAMM|nr:methylenetetrahydrofolate reductase [Halomonas andesensis]RUR31481.1 methylenetetrahydrofolate reductase [Halomonas andesensis]
MINHDTGDGRRATLASAYSSNSRLERVLKAGYFAVTSELAPPDSANPEDVYARARVFDGYVDSMNATDGSGANCHMSSVAMCALLSRVGYDTVMQISCRDRNRIAIQGDVLGAAALGVNNILCLTGDGVQVGDHPEAKPVFDLDSMSLLDVIVGLRDKKTFVSGRKISDPPRVFLGAAENPFVPPQDFRPYRLAKKIAAGAQFIQTQYCFDLPQFETFMARSRDLGLLEKCFILPGVGPLASARAANWMRSHVPGVHIPDAVIKRLEGAQDQKEEGRQICIEMIQQLREIQGVSGVHVMAHRQESAVADIIKKSGVLDERRPWVPDSEQQRGEQQRGEQHKLAAGFGHE